MLRTEVVVRELERYLVKVLALQETKWLATQSIESEKVWS